MYRILTLAAAACLMGFTPAAAGNKGEARTEIAMSTASDFSAAPRKKKSATVPAKKPNPFFTDPSRPGHGRIQSYRR